MVKMDLAISQIVMGSKQFCRLVINPILKIWLQKMIKIIKEESWTKKMLKPQKEEQMDKTDFPAIAQTSTFKTTEHPWT